MPELLRALSPTCCISQSRVYATNSAIFHSGRESVLVDPGVTPMELNAIRAFISARRSVARALVLTHAHWDHIMGPAWFPGVPILAHRAYAAVLNAHAHHLQQLVTRWRHAEGLAPEPAYALPQPDCSFDEQVTVEFGDHELLIVAAPGHAPDHCALYEPESGLLFAGDMLSDLEIPMVMDSFAAYRQTMSRLAGLQVRVLVPGHGTPTADPVEISDRFAHDGAYLDAVSACASQAVARGATLTESVKACEHIRFTQPDEYPNAHRWNIEQAYLEAGGEVEGDAGLIGWEQDWL